MDATTGAGAPLHPEISGWRVASFQIIGEIGRGGMGVVYRALDLKLEREVALKRPRPEYLERPDFHQRFIDEARTASQLMHPNITTVFEVLEYEGVPWLVMELIDGASLRSLLTDRNPFPFEQVLHHAEGLADALRVAHLSGVLHRDINPNNILVGSDGRARLCDFGLARAYLDPTRGPGTTDVVTETAPPPPSVAGTRGYMSPEHVMGKTLDPRSDIFSLGTVLYEMCTARPVFLRRSHEDSLDALLHHEPPPVHQLNQEVPAEFDAIVRRCLAKRPFQRFGSASEMLLEVRALRRRLQSDSGHSWDVPKVRTRSGVGRYLAAALALAALALGVTWLVVSPRRSPDQLTGWTPRQITSSSGWETEPQLSPDGSVIAFVSNESGNPDIWLTSVHGGEPLRLTDHPASDRQPSWFPDGSSLAFASQRGEQTGIWRIPRLGGTPMLVVPDGTDPAVSPDGARIAFAQRSSSGLFRIAVAPISVPERARILTGDKHGAMDHRHPAWSPDGKYICYADFRDLWIAPLDGSRPYPLTNDQKWDRDPVWTGDGRFIYFSSGRGGTQAIWRVPSTGGEPQRITAGTGPEVNPSLSRDGTLLSFSTYNEDQELLVLDRETGHHVRMRGSRFRSLPAIAPDGSAVAFAVNHGTQFDLWLQPLQEDGSLPRPRRLTDHPATVAMPTFSPDGEWIAFFGRIGSSLDVWTVPVHGGVPTRFTDEPAADAQPSFSPDGDKLAFSSARGGSRPRIFVAPIANGRPHGEARPITAGDCSAFSPSWSPDGSRLAYVGNCEGTDEAWVVGLTTDREPRQITDGAQAHYVRWDPRSKELLVSGGWGTGRAELRTVSIETGVASRLDPPVRFGGEDAVGLFSVTSTGRLVAYYDVAFGGDIWLYEREASSPPGQ
jgi:Tol biopolymer transport system component